MLKYAFEGKLTEKWREENKDKLEPASELIKKIKVEREKKYQEDFKKWEKDKKAGKKTAKPRKPEELPPLTEQDLAELPELPEGWEWVRLGEVISDVKYGTSKKCHLKKVGNPVLRIPNIINGDIDIAELKYAIFSNDEKLNYRLMENDILLIRSNGSISIVGKTAVVKKEINGYLFAGYLIRLRLINSLNESKEIHYIFSSVIIRNQIERFAKSTSGVHNINTHEICTLKIPMITKEEQVQIVTEIETRLSVADNLEKSIDKSIQKAEALRQSILKKAFEGSLVPQDPKDESAEVLLERIKAEKAKLIETNGRSNKITKKPVPKINKSIVKQKKKTKVANSKRKTGKFKQGKIF